MSWTIQENTTDPWRTYSVFLDNVSVIEAKWKPISIDSVEIHCECRGTIRAIRKAREVFDRTVRLDIKEAGYERIIAVFPIDRASKALRFVRLMGFDFFAGMMEA